MRGDRISGLVILLFALFIIRESVLLDIGGFRQPGPGLFALISAILLALLSSILLLQSLAPRTDKGEDKPLKSGNEKLLQLIYLFIGLIVYAVVFEWLGFILSTFSLVVLSMTLFEKKGWPVVLLTASIVSFATYFVFDVLLKSELPAGVLALLSGG